jgi:hypothetical protein
MPVWMVCSACRTGIGHGAKHWVCSVSTCNQGRTRLVFCSVPCWDSHVVVLRHREAWAVEAVAPAEEQAEARRPATGPATRPAAATAAGAPGGDTDAEAAEILVVVSKIKKYIRDRSGMNTSDAVAAALSDHVRELCDLAIRGAGAAGRKTVLDRDVPRPRHPG